MKKSDRKGFTVIELLVALAFIVFWVFIVPGILCGNFWFTEEKVLRQLKYEHSGVTEIVKTKRGLYDYSVITVRENGAVKTYRLNSNIFFNYTFH